MGSWLVFDDDTVDSIKESDIPKYFGDSNSGSAYVLYYQALDIDFSALGRGPLVPEPEPVMQPVPRSEPPQPWPPNDSPASTAQSIPPLPPGLNDAHVPAPVPEAPPRSITPPTSIHPTLDLYGKSPRKVPSQPLKGPPVTGGHGSSRGDTVLRTSRSTLDAKPSLQPIAILPKGDIKPLQGPVGAVNGKEKDSDKSVMGWLRRPLFKTVKSRPSSELSAERPLSQDALSVPGSPVRNQSISSSSNSSKDSRRQLDSPTSSHRSRVSPLPNGRPPPRSRAADTSPYETDSRHSSTSANSSTFPTSPLPERRSQSRTLPSIPASPHVPMAEIPPSVFTRGSLDHNRAPRRHARPSIKGLNAGQSPKSPGRPATSAGTGPTQTRSPLPSMSLPNSPPPVPKANITPSKSDPGDDVIFGRPRSAHATYGFLMLPPSTATPAASTPVSTPCTTGRRATRKLSLTAPMLGFKRREKEPQ